MDPLSLTVGIVSLATLAAQTLVRVLLSLRLLVMDFRSWAKFLKLFLSCKPRKPYHDLPHIVLKIAILVRSFLPRSKAWVPVLVQKRLLLA